MSHDDADRQHRLSRDRETIRQWADEREAVPARRTEGDQEEWLLVRETDMDDTHERAEWDEFFATLEDRDHVVVHRETEARDAFDVLAREEAMTASDVEREEIERALTEGETVTSEVTETTVVESVIVEEATIESELVDTDLVEERVVDAELLERECTGCEFVADGTEADAALLDEERYFDALETGGRSDLEGAGVFGPAGETDVPYHAELDVRETWAVTREQLERLTVESTIVDTDVEEADTVEDHDIELEGVQRDILESGLFEGDQSAEEIMAQCDIQSEFGEGDTIHTYFNRRRTFEDEVVDEKRLRADVTGGEILGMEGVDSTEVRTEFTDDEGLAPLESGTTGESAAEPALEDEPAGAEGETGATGGSAGAEGETGATGGSAGATAGAVTLTEDDVGKDVIDDKGDTIGMVADVDETENTLYIDAEPSITERIKAALDWGGGEEDYPIRADQVQEVDDDQVRLKEREELVEGNETR